jgi:uncharacterized protein
MSKPIFSTPSAAVAAVRNAPRAALIALLRVYKVVLSPLFPGACRFVPSCSDYAALAIREHGAIRGLWLATRRLARCHPYGGSGIDAVPPRNA